MSQTIKELPELERPYEKFEKYGGQALSNAELLAIIIKTGTKEETVVNLAQRILSLNPSNKGDLRFIQNLEIEELQKIKGVGKVKAIQLKAVWELALRIFRNENYEKTIIKDPHDVAKLLMGELKNETKEIIKIIMLNQKNEVLKIKTLATGSGDFVKIPASEILSEPVKILARKIIVVHNHPSGDATPSEEDINFTERLKNKFAMLDINLIDHIVIGNMEYTSIMSMLNAKDKELNKREKERIDKL